MGKYDEAIENLEKASKINPDYVGLRVRAMKYLIKNEQPLLSLIIGGGVLVLTEDPKAQSQVWDMASGVALDISKKSNDIKDLKESLYFANKAAEFAPDDIVSNWNRTELLFYCEKIERKIGNSENANSLLESSKKAVEDILDFARKRRGNSALYWHRLTNDAKKIFPTDAYWRIKLEEMNRISEEIDDNKIDDNTSNPPTTRKNTNSQKRNFLKVAAILAFLAWPLLLDKLPVLQNKLSQSNKPPITAPQQNQHKDKTIDSNEKEKVKISIPNTKTKFTLARLERDDEEMARTLLTTLKNHPRLERDDEDMV